MEIAVIVGRFQSSHLHQGYLDIFTQSFSKYSQVGVIIGSSNEINERNPLPFRIRSQMLNTEIPQISFTDEIYDDPSDYKWSEKLDLIIENNINLLNISSGNLPSDRNYININKCVLIGSRDSFIKNYYGIFRTEYIQEINIANSTNVRSKITVSEDSNWKLGYASAALNQPNNPTYNINWVEGWIYYWNNYFKQENDKKENFILMSDSYKLTHWKMYQPNTQYIYSYLEARTGSKFNSTIFFGLQYILDKLANVRIKKSDIIQAEQLCSAHIGPNTFNADMWNHICENLNGILPLEIRAVPEGTIVPVGNVLMTVVNTDPKCASLTNFVESLLLHVWYPSTVCTLSYEIKQILKSFLIETSDDWESSIKFMLHDFGYRGVSSNESAAIGGLAHLVNFSGTDTLLALQCGKKTYSTNYDSNLAGYSVNASEHSIMTVKGRNGEFEIIEQLINEYPSGILSIVLDSYNIYEAVKYIGTTLKNKILNRNGKLVIRPDSGYPPEVTIEILKILDLTFGSTINSKGFKILNPKLGIIYGDGIDINMIRTICSTMKDNGWATNNIVFGMGGGLLQKINRDTQRFAFKCSATCINNEWHDVQKDPITTTANETKKSKAGHLILTKDSNLNYITKRVSPSEYPNPQDILQLVFANGKIIKRYTFDEVKNNTSNV